jgi:predicted Mrr-cat superfamily restriction endonuclease
MVRDDREAEELAAEWMRYLGYTDARCTPPGADGGVDVVSARAVAQVKFEARPTGRPATQRLYGCAAAAQKSGVFFSLAGYTEHARAFADSVGVALFRWAPDGSQQPINDAARRMVADAEART